MLYRQFEGVSVKFIPSSLWFRPPKNTCTPTLHKSHKIFDIRLMYNQPFNIGSDWCTAYLTTNGASDERPILQQRERVMYDLSYDKERPILRQRTNYLTTKVASDVRPILRQRERLMYDLSYDKGSEWCTTYLNTRKIISGVSFMWRGRQNSASPRIEYIWH